MRLGGQESIPRAATQCGFLDSQDHQMTAITITAAQRPTADDEAR